MEEIKLARIMQVTCDSATCYNVIELVAEEEFEIEHALTDFSWGTLDGEDFCQDCYVEDWEESESKTNEEYPSDY